MNKIAQYLNEHIQGEVSTSAAERKAFSTDASVLSITPEIVTYPRVTNDIRKIARFSWQLADKGHIMPITTRGGGSDQTGAAIGKGIIVNTTAHMNTIFELDTKQKLVRAQPGVSFKALNDALALHGLQIPSFPASESYSTIGGAIANNSSGMFSGKYGGTASWVHQLEIVLANGDVLQTGRISKRELNKKKGLQTMEGEIYRQLDNLITDNKQLIDEKVGSASRDNVGYGGIIDVKHKNGSFDIAPLFAGSQGTLGIISEVIMKTDFFQPRQTTFLVSFENYEHAHDGLDDLVGFDPAVLEVIDGHLFAEAKKRGKKYDFMNTAEKETHVGAVVFCILDDPSERVQKKKLKKIKKAMDKRGAVMTVATNEVSRMELMSVRNVAYIATHPDGDHESAPPLIDGAYVPAARFDDFSKACVKLAEKHHVNLHLYGRAIEGIYHTRPVLNMAKVGDRQKVLKLLSEYSALVNHHGGHLIGEAAEGRLKAPFALKELDPDVRQLYADIKDIFDPLGILNPGVKQSTDIKTLVSAMRSEYSLAQFANHSPTN